MLAFWVAITLLRVLRTPEAVFVQATGNYPALARISGFAGAVTLAVTLVLLMAFGPIASLGGVVAGEVVDGRHAVPADGEWRRRIA